jgi:hypothetical protein
MPHVFALEGLSATQLAGAQLAAPTSITPNSGVTVVHYPQDGSPLGPHGVPIGPARPQVPVYGPGGTPVAYRAAYPARGPVCDYCAPTTAALNGPGLGFDLTEYLGRQSPAMTAAIGLVGAMLVGSLLGGAAVWAFRAGGGENK